MTTTSTDHDRRFVEYYAEESLSAEAQERFQAIMSLLLRVRAADGSSVQNLTIGDVGCNTGTQSIMWARAGHRVRGLDISAQLVEMARERARAANTSIEFTVGSATQLPWENESIDVCIAPELLEHVADWQKVLDECARVTRKGGLVYVSTTNVLCPKQNEFDLPLYSWYPPFLKRYYERVSVTTRPELVNHTKYPAVHWFTFYGLREAMRKRGFTSRDRFDLIAVKQPGGAASAIVGTIRAVPPLRWLAHVMTPYVVIVGSKVS